MSKTNRKMVKIILIAWLAYLFSYLGRSDYGACLLEIINETGISRSLAGSVSSSFAICNAIGQLISVIIINKYHPIKVIGFELIAVALINFFLPITDSFLIMALLWGINGFLQSTLLCGLTKIFICTLKEPHLSGGTVLLNTVGAVGGMFNYVLSWFIIRFFDWKVVFITVSGLLAILALVWCIIMPKLAGEKHDAEISKKQQSDKKRKVRCSVLLGSNAAVFVIIAGMFVGLLRESVSLWIPTYMNDIHKLTREMSVIITAFVPCLQVCGALFGGYIGRKSKDLLLLSAAAFFISGICLVIIKTIGSISIVITLGMFIINAISMTAALTFLHSLYPIRYFSKENVVFIIGITNFFTHFGDFISSFGVGWLSQNKGWTMTFVVLAIMAFSASVICVAGSKINNRKGQRDGEIRA